ncbi:MAG TPA: hypothetical protein VGJ20_30665 [Xanthobacteraceae bacterium]
MMRSVILAATALVLSGATASAQYIYVDPYAAPGYLAPTVVAPSYVAPAYVAPPPAYVAPAPAYVAPLGPSIVAPPPRWSYARPLDVGDMATPPYDYAPPYPGTYVVGAPGW